MTGASDWNRISPLSALFFIFRLLRQVAPQAAPGFVALFAVMFSSDGIGRVLLPVALTAIPLLMLGFGLLSWLRFRYRVVTDRIQVRQGVLEREELDIEFERIQNIGVREPFYMRPLGLAVLAVDTAGTTDKEIELAGIRKTLALEIRTRLLQDSSVAAGEALGDESPEASGAPDAPGNGAHGATLLLELERREVLLYGLTANVMLWAALALAAFFGTGDVAESTIEGVINHPNVQQAALTLQREGGAVLLGIAVTGLGLLVLLSLPLISMLGALLRFDGYRLTLQDETFRRNSGLLTRHDESLRRHKIQAVVWKQNFIARWLGLINLQLRQASAGTGADNGPMPGKPPFTVPSLRLEQAHAMMSRFLPACDSRTARFSPVDAGRYLRVNLVIVLTLFAIPLSLPALLAHPAWYALLLPIGAVCWFVLWRMGRAFGWAVDGEYGYIRRGFLGHTTTIFPLFKVQRVDIRQTPVQHRKGIAHLTVHLASHSLTLPYVRMEDAVKLRDLALFAAESSDRRWY
jgi:putative membrane protein